MRSTLCADSTWHWPAPERYQDEALGRAQRAGAMAITPLSADVSARTNSRPIRHAGSAITGCASRSRCDSRHAGAHRNTTSSGAVMPTRPQKCDFPENKATFGAVKASNFEAGDYSNAFDSGLNSKLRPGIRGGSLDMPMAAERTGAVGHGLGPGDHHHANDTMPSLEQASPERHCKESYPRNIRYHLLREES